MKRAVPRAIRGVLLAAPRTSFRHASEGAQPIAARGCATESDQAVCPQEACAPRRRVCNPRTERNWGNLNS